MDPASHPSPGSRPPPAPEDRSAPLGVIGAMPEEVEALLAALEPLADGRDGRPAREEVGGFALHRGRLDGRDVLLAECGVGKVNAAALAQTLLLRGARALVFTGVAGGVDPELRVGDLVVSTDAVQHDVDVTPLGYGPGVVPGEAGAAWSADPALLAAALGAARAVAEEDGLRVVAGRVASGDRFIADPARVAELRERFGAACAEMEGAAVAQVAARSGAPWVVVRSISDTADHDASVDFRAFTGLAAGRAKRVVRGLLARLPR